MIITPWWINFMGVTLLITTWFFSRHRFWNASGRSKWGTYIYFTWNRPRDYRYRGRPNPTTYPNIHSWPRSSGNCADNSNTSGLKGMGVWFTIEFMRNRRGGGSKLTLSRVKSVAVTPFVILCTHNSSIVGTRIAMACVVNIMQCKKSRGWDLEGQRQNRFDYRLLELAISAISYALFCLIYRRVQQCLICQN